MANEEKVIVTKSKLDALATSISTKSGQSLPMTIAQMKSAVDGISGGGGITPTGTVTITTNGTHDVTNYASAVVNVSSEAPSLQSKTATPTESAQTINPDSGYDGLSSVEIGAISSTYVGSGITQRDGDDLTASGATVTVPAGYYAENVSKSVASGTAGTPTANKGAVSNHSISITPSVTNTTGYITGGTKNGTAVTVTASELASGNKAITANGTDIDVVGYSTVSVDVFSPAIVLSDNLHNSSEDVANTYISGSTETAYNGWSSTGYIPVKPDTWYRIQNTPGNVYNAFYKSDKTEEKKSVSIPTSYNEPYSFIKTTSNTAYIRMSGSSSDVANYEIYEVEIGLPTGNINITSNGNYNVSEYATANINVSAPSVSLQEKTGINPTTSSQTITADSGYDGLSSVQINAMPSGSATTPAITITTNPSISVSSSGLITATASASQSITPTVSAGYVSTGTSGTVTVSGSKTQQLTALGATTYNTSTTDQTIASGRYITGTQTIKAVTVSGLSAENIASGVTVKVGDANDDDRIVSVTGTLAFQTIYTGSSAPSSSLGSNGDIYIQS